MVFLSNVWMAMTSSYGLMLLIGLVMAVIGFLLWWRWLERPSVPAVEAQRRTKTAILDAVNNVQLTPVQLPQLQPPQLPADLVTKSSVVDAVQTALDMVIGIAHTNGQAEVESAFTAARNDLATLINGLPAAQLPAPQQQAPVPTNLVEISTAQTAYRNAVQNTPLPPVAPVPQGQQQAQDVPYPTWGFVGMGLGIPLMLIMTLFIGSMGGDATLRSEVPPLIKDLLAAADDGKVNRDEVKEYTLLRAAAATMPEGPEKQAILKKATEHYRTASERYAKALVAAERAKNTLINVKGFYYEERTAAGPEGMPRTTWEGLVAEWEKKFPRTVFAPGTPVSPAPGSPKITP